MSTSESSLEAGPEREMMGSSNKQSLGIDRASPELDVTHATGFDTHSACPDRILLLSLTRDGLPATRSNEVVAHIETCTLCQTTLATLTDLPANDVSGQDGNSVSPHLPKFLQRLRNSTPFNPPDDEDWQTLLTSSPDLRPDEIGRLGGYSVMRELGRGGMGIVLLARDIHLDRMVALKIMRSSTVSRKGLHERFLREARAVASVDHPHVCPIFQVGKDDRKNIPFMAMKFLKGESLSHRLRSTGTLDSGTLRRIGQQTAEGLDAIHRVGHVHRDIKPGNIWLEAPDDHVRVLDFGLIQRGDDLRITREGELVGTPAYMSPEQARGEKVGPQSDLFSLGVVLYESACGKLPFDGATTMGTLSALANNTPVPLCECSPDLDPNTGELIMQLLEKDPNLRPASTEDVAARLRCGRSPTEPLASAGVVPSQANPGYAAVGVEGPADGVRPGTDTAVQLSRGQSERVSRLVTGFAAVVVLFGIILLSLRTSKGTIIVELGDGVSPEAVSIEATVDGVVKVMDANNGWTIDIAAGKCSVHLNEGNDRFRLDRTSVEVTRNRKAHLRVLLKPDSPLEISQDRKVAMWAKSVGGRVTIDTDGGRERISPGESLPESPLSVVSLDFLYTAVTDDDVARITGLKRLNMLRLGVTSSGPGLTARGLQHLVDADLPALKFVYLYDFPVHAAELTQIAKLNLTMLNLRRSQTTDDDLRALADNRSLKSLNFQQQPLTGDGFRHLKSLPLQSLATYDVSLTDESLQTMPRWPRLSQLHLRFAPLTELSWLKNFSKLETLTLQGLPDLEEDDWQVLEELQHLKELRLKASGGLHGGDVVRITASRHELTHLTLEGTDFKHADFVDLNRDQMPHLRELILSSSPSLSGDVIESLRTALPDCEIRQVPDNSVAAWVLSVGGTVSLLSKTNVVISEAADLPGDSLQVHTIDLRGTDISDGDLSRIDGLKHLLRLYLGDRSEGGSSLTVESFRTLAQADLPMLYELHLFGIPLSKVGHVEVSKFQKLVSLTLSETNTTDDDLWQIAQLPKLRYLTLASDDLRGTGLRHFERHKLSLLSLTGRSLENSAFIEFPDWESLQSLRIDQAPLSDSALLSFGRYAGLTELLVNHAGTLNGSSWQMLDSLSALQQLTLTGNSSVTDDVVKHVVETLPKLSVLQIASTRVSDAGLQHLRRATNLSLLDVRSNPAITAQAVEKLKTTLTDCTIRYDPDE